MRCPCVLPLCSQAHHLHMRSHCRFSVPACRYRCRKATFGSIFLVYSDIIGGRGATGMGPQEKDSQILGAPFSRSDFGHVFGRPLVAKRLQIRGQHGSRIHQQVSKKRVRKSMTFFHRILIDFGGPGSLKSMQNA